MAKMRSGARWLNNHYAANDHYSESERVRGEWMGRGAEYLGLTHQSIEGEDRAFLVLFSGRTPHGEKLKQRSSEIIGYDFQCSAQKSVSIMAIVAGDYRLVDAHRMAVKEAFRELEELLERDLCSCANEESPEFLAMLETRISAADKGGRSYTLTQAREALKNFGRQLHQ